MDNLDRKILLALQKNGRISNSDLARKFGVAPSTMLERIRHLEESGTLRGYRAIIDAKALGLTVQGFVSVVLYRHDRDYIRTFEEEVQTIPYLKACYHVTGRFDYLLHVAVRDLDHLGKLVKEWISSITGVGKVETFLVFSEVKSDESWVIDNGMENEEI